MNESFYICNNCGKRYIRFDQFIKHKDSAICIPITSRLEYLNDNSSDLDNLKKESKLMLIINQLIESNKDLKKEISSIKQKQNKTLKKISVENLLNKKYKPKINFTFNLFDNFELNIFDLQDKTLIDYIVDLILNLNVDEKILRALLIKKNEIYYFSDQWNLLSHDDLIKIIKLLYNKSLNLFIQWQSTINFEIPSQSEKYLLLAKKINSINLINNESVNKIKKKIFEKISQSIEIIEYEII